MGASIEDGRDVSMSTKDDQRSVSDRSVSNDKSNSYKVRVQIITKVVQILYNCKLFPAEVDVFMRKLCQLYSVDIKHVNFLGAVMMTFYDQDPKDTGDFLAGSCDKTITRMVYTPGKFFQLDIQDQIYQHFHYQFSGKECVCYDSTLKFLSQFDDFGLLYSTFTQVLCIGGLSGSAAGFFFGGTIYDMIVGTILGLMVGAWVKEVCPFDISVLKILREFISAFFVSLVLLVFLVISGQRYTFWCMFFGIQLWDLPGFTIVYGFHEIFWRNIFCGTAFVIYGFMTAANTALGISLACYIFRLCLPNGIDFPLLLRGGEVPVSNYPILQAVLTIFFPITLCYIYSIRPKKMPFSIILTLLTVQGYLKMASVLPSELNNFFVSFVLGFVTHTLCFMFGYTPETSLYSAILPLVPGSGAVGSVFELLKSIHGVEMPETQAFITVGQVAIISACIAFGQYSSRIFSDAVCDTCFSVWMRVSSYIKSSIRQAFIFNSNKKTAQ